MSLVIFMLLLILACGFDSGLEVANTRSSETFIRTPVIWLNAVILLVFAVAMLGIAWFVLIRKPMPKVVSWMYLFIGCSIVFLNPIQFTLGISLTPIWFNKLSANSFLIRAGAFTAIIGIIDLIRKKTH
jgi:uncharacterized membrane protein